MKEITDRLEQGITELFDSERYKEYLKVMSRFHNYSFNNTLLIAMQKPDASLVAGFTAWKNNFQRNVIKGEKGIKIGKLFSDFVGFLIAYFPRLKGLYQMVGEIVPFLYGLCKRKSEFNVCRFIAAPKRGHKHFPVCFIRVLDIVKGFAQRAFNRLNLCNRHISASTPFISSMSSWYAFPVAFTRRAIWLTLTPIFCISAVIAFISAWSI